MSMNVSLDGCADHRVAVADDELHDFVSNLFNNVEILLFGRVTYELMASYWPHAHEDPNATASMLRFAKKINAMQKIVFSKTLEKADWNNTSLAKNDMVEEVIKLKQESGKALSAGGISVCQELMRHGLIDEFWILVHPIIWGKGRRLFDDSSDKKVRLRLLSTKTFKSGVVVLHYQPAPSTRFPDSS